MTSRFALAFLFSAAFSASAFAEIRPWKSADGTKTIQADFVSRDAAGVKIRLADGKEATIELAKLHADDKKWLDLNHPLGGVATPDDAAVFDTLKFGDKHDAVLTKLKASKFVEMTMAESMISRTGLNGIFRLRQKIGGQQATLFFDWTDTEALNEITVRTDAFPAESFDAKLAPCWKEFIELLTTLHGKPLQAAPKIDPASVPNGSMISSHVWQLESGGSALLGVGCEGTNYQVIVRFTPDKVAPVTSTGRPGKPAGLDIDFEP